MAAHVEVISSDFRRHKVRLSPETPMIDVLEEVTKKWKVRIENYQLKHKNKSLELHNAFRQSGLTAGAKLDLVMRSSSPTAVNLKLDIADMGTITLTLPNDMTLWQVLRQVEGRQQDWNIVLRPVGTGQTCWFEPILRVVAKEYSGLEQLQRTLAQCCIGNGTLLKVFFRASKTPYEEAILRVQELSEALDPKQPPERGANATVGSASADESKKMATARSDATDAKTEDATFTDVAEPPISIAPSPPTETSRPSNSDLSTPFTTEPLAPTCIFQAPSSSTPAATRIREDESAFEPTVAHAQLRQQQLEGRSRNQRLKSDLELATIAAEKAVRLERITTVRIRVRFPDQTSADWTVGREHTAAYLYSAVRAVMARPHEPFRLSKADRSTVSEDERTLIADHGIRANELLTLVWEAVATDEARGAPFLKQSVVRQATEIPIPEVPERVEVPEAGPSKSNTKPEKGTASAMDPEALRNKMSKLFKLGKK